MMWYSSGNDIPTRYCSSGNLVSDAGFVHPSRQLDTCVLLVGLQGQLWIEQNGIEHVIRSGQFMLLFPGYHHGGTRPSPGPLSYFWCHFYPVSDYLISPDEEGIRFDELQQKIHLPEQGNIGDLDKIVLEFRKLIDLSRSNFYTHVASDYSISLLLMNLTQEAINTHLGSSIPSHTLITVKNIQQYIHANYSGNLSVEALETIFGYNPNYLSTVFRKTTGRALTAYVNDIRIRAARDLLLETNETILSVAHNVGFSDDKYFIRVFKQHEGVTPSHFRNIYFRKHMNTK